jgi:hypothetical protein
MMLTPEELAELTAYHEACKGKAYRYEDEILGPAGISFPLSQHAHSAIAKLLLREPRLKPAFDHSKRVTKYFENLLGYCVCEHCKKLPSEAFAAGIHATSCSKAHDHSKACHLAGNYDPQRIVGSSEDRTEDQEQLFRLKIALAEYASIDDRVPEKKLLQIIRDAVVRPTSELPLILLQKVPGTELYRINRIPSCKMTEAEKALAEQVDDFRTENPT